MKYINIRDMPLVRKVHYRKIAINFFGIDGVKWWFEFFIDDRSYGNTDCISDSIGQRMSDAWITAKHMIDNQLERKYRSEHD